MMQKWTDGYLPERRVCPHRIIRMRLCEGVDERAVTTELGEDAECDEWNS